ncbi:FAD/FMN-containing dehydrogenase [Kytococcus aerolatus]|uniref:FAD/FMN-containing dehydrogenase n=1 Tax=Kytococcus aerolatus TaxID=592308 RepID=A0A212U5U6_9MICO|nr:FAD-binding and (Fe-S)-binding domain-containing protein [Kytococcus aerolatus]SNC73520.1 FAD/FMN-containing dehydrogenase [Kytococcus aerolatus]
MAVTSTTPLAEHLRGAGLNDVRADAATLATRSSDASLYRISPQVVVLPHDAEEVALTVELARQEGVPITARGAGTSIAGNAIGPGIVLDFSRHMNRVLELDAEARTARVQPGVVQARLQDAARPHGLFFGPDPSTSTRCTIGGMIGNNACGTKSLAYGRTSDNTLAVEGVLADGRLLSAAETELQRELRALVSTDLATVRTQFARFGRQASGYALEHLLPENGTHLPGLLVGSEGTLAVLTEATVRLVERPASSRLVVLGFATQYDAADAVPALLEHRPTACEGLDARLVDVLRDRRGPQAVPELPRGAAWLFVELAGDTTQEVEEAAQRLVAVAGPELQALDARDVPDPAEARALWRIRSDGAGLAGRSAENEPAHAGWEDAAVPPDQLGDYLRRFDELLEEHGLSAAPYGHFGEGCMHVRLDLPLEASDGVARSRAFLEDAARLVADFGGSMSGEHGDGRARSELLPYMYSPEALRLFAGVKHLFDPAGLLNPGVLVDPEPLDAHLRLPALRTDLPDPAFTYPEDGGLLSRAVHRCTGVGKCIADGVLDRSQTVMCPSFLATREEQHSTRGRARVLQEVLSGESPLDVHSPAVHDSLDLCLSCKGCASDCPTGVDMATLKSEVLHQRYRGRLRPITHYSLGWLPRWVALAARTPGLANAMMRLARRVPVLLRAAGIDPRRGLPSFAPRTFRGGAVARSLPRAVPGAGGAVAAPVRSESVAARTRQRVVLFVDTFSEAFTPQAAGATVQVLQAAGFEVDLLPRQTCCGLTWITTGQLDTARRLLEQTVEQLRPLAEQGVPIVGIEPSCTGVLRKDAPELLGTPAARTVAAQTFTLAELLHRAEWTPPSLEGVRVLAQPHCHHHAVMGWEADKRLLERAGARVEALAGCCGLAGNFGVEQGHYEVSVAVAEQYLLPALRRGEHDVVLTDGFSCRLQASDLGGAEGRHLAELLAAQLDTPAADPTPTPQEEP